MRCKVLEGSWILNFIKKFKFKYAKELEEVFTTGDCYYFAIILKARFAGDIYYLPVANHFVTKIGSCYYDITGRVEPDEHPIKWSEFGKGDASWRRRVVRDCIDFDTRKG